MPLIKIKKSNVPSTNPWGTPNNISPLLEMLAPTWVVWVVSVKYNAKLIIPRIRWWLNLHSSIIWSTVSKAFFRSINTPHEYKPASIYIKRSCCLTLLRFFIIFYFLKFIAARVISVERVYLLKSRLFDTIVDHFSKTSISVTLTNSARISIWKWDSKPR